METPKGAVILDPWNGSGTTVAACASLGVSCHGYDINPVMVHLGRARVASELDFEEAAETVSRIESIFAAAEQIGLAEIGDALRQTQDISVTARSSAIAALFPFARAQLRNAKTKNPAWFKSGVNLSANPLKSNTFFEDWHRLVQELNVWRTPNAAKTRANLTVEIGDSRQVIGGGKMFDGVITSPPYLTRLDYVQATLPEYLLLKEIDDIASIRTLRESMIGSPLTKEQSLNDIEELPDHIKNILRLIENHSSKASSTYYHRFFAAYFIGLRKSISNISRCLKLNAGACIVVQSSHYKEIDVDLVGAVIELGEQFDLSYQFTWDFDSKRSMSLVNSRAHALARTPKKESAIFLRKI